jgi:glucose-6-phosphate isomerase
MVMAVTWSTNSFDQWGVDLGKTLALSEVRRTRLTSTPMLIHDSPTSALIRRCRQLEGLS